MGRFCAVLGFLVLCIGLLPCWDLGGGVFGPSGLPLPFAGWSSLSLELPWLLPLVFLVVVPPDEDDIAFLAISSRVFALAAILFMVQVSTQTRRVEGDGTSRWSSFMH